MTFERVLFLSVSSGLPGLQVGSMCDLVVEAVAKGHGRVEEELRRLLGKAVGEELPETGKELAG